MKRIRNYDHCGAQLAPAKIFRPFTEVIGMLLDLVRSRPTETVASDHDHPQILRITLA